MTAQLIDFRQAHQDREFQRFLAKMSADLVVMNAAELILSDLSKHLERKALRASRGLPEDLSASPSGSGSHHGEAE
jgi:hypothetical protein